MRTHLKRRTIMLAILGMLLLLPLAFSPLALASGYRGWYAQTSGVSQVLMKVAASSADHAWAAGGPLLETTDGGVSWAQGYSGPYSGSFYGVSAPDGNVVWACTQDGQVIRSEDAGTVWETSTIPANTSLKDIYAVDANSAWAISDSRIFVTSTGGTSWTEVTDPSVGSQLMGIAACSATTAMVAVWDGTLMRTTDGGAHWSKKSIAPNLMDIDLRPQNPNIVYATDYGIYKSVDGGLSWKSSQYAASEALMGISAVDAGTTWAAGFHGTIAKTIDAGKTWYQQPSGTTADFFGICAFDTSNAWVVGRNGVVRHTTDGGGYHTPPAIDGITPNSGRVGSEVTLRGSDFGCPQSLSYVSFGTVQATDYVSWADDEVHVKVPEGLNGPVDVAIHTAGGASNARRFTVVTPKYYSYYFAEGCTREGFEEWLCLQNPGAAPLPVTATYMLFGGAAPVQKTYTVPATSRLSVNVNAEVGPGQDVSAKLVAEGEFYAERPVYFNYKQEQPGYSWTGGHCVTGSTAPGNDWYFAEGTTRHGFEEWVCLQNPGSGAASVNVDYVSAGAYTVRKQYTVDANSRLTVFVNGDVGPDQDVSVHVRSDQPVVAERPMYFNYKGKWDGGHIVMGTDSPKTRWYFAEGSTREGFNEWLAVQNANGTDAHVTCHFLNYDGQRWDNTYTVGANSRWTLDVESVIGENKDTMLTVDSDLPVVAERPIYFDYKDSEPGYGCTGGHTVIGAGQAKTGWFFAEGCTREGFDEYICIGNPGDEKATVNITFMLETGQLVTRSVQVEAHRRMTIMPLQSVPRGHDVSTRIASDKPVVAERPMYFTYGGKWNGGHDVIGF